MLAKNEIYLYLSFRNLLFLRCLFPEQFDYSLTIKKMNIDEADRTYHQKTLVQRELSHIGIYVTQQFECCLK